MLINFVLLLCGRISYIRYLLVIFYYLTSGHGMINTSLTMPTKDRGFLSLIFEQVSMGDHFLTISLAQARKNVTIKYPFTFNFCRNKSFVIFIDIVTFSKKS